MGLFLCKIVFSKNPKKPEFFSKVPETQVLKICPELETLICIHARLYNLKDDLLQ